MKQPRSAGREAIVELFTINLTAAPSSSLKIAWFVLG